MTLSITILDLLDELEADMESIMVTKTDINYVFAFSIFANVMF